jgi:hypothetical protein
MNATGCALQDCSAFPFAREAGKVLISGLGPATGGPAPIAQW